MTPGVTPGVHDRTARTLAAYESRGRAPTVGFECPEDLLARLDRVADASHCERSEVVRRLLRAALASIDELGGLA